MRKYLLLILFLITGLLLGCGENQPGNQAPAIQFSSQVSFGDSLSDVGSYGVGAIAAAGGGQFTINGVGYNWTELMAAQLDLTAPCPAMTGGYGTPTATATACFGYAQGGARVTNPAGPGNAGPEAGGTYPGAMTIPVATQVANHLAAVGGSFSGDEVVFVLAGANDVFTQAATYAALVGGGMLPNDAMTTVVAAMTTAANELATLVTDQMIANGANYVVAINIPDISNTPIAVAGGAATMGLYDALVTTFNTTLKTQLQNNANVLLVDAYSVNRDQIYNPAIYGLSNVTETACDTGILPSGSSLFCTASTLRAGVDDYYLFADDVHPTPYGYLLLARLVAKEMVIKGWL
jgi:outer membrane lipase/esterase